jgi:large subunit ribosomal protein L21
MFAVIRTGGKQYRVAPNDIIEIERIAGEPGDIVELGEVLLLGADGGPQTGSPLIAGALVAAEVIEHTRADKIIVFKKKRRKNYRRKRGHRQALTMLRITEILTDGKRPSETKAARPEPKRAEPQKPTKSAKASAGVESSVKTAKQPAPKKATKRPAAKKAAPAKKPATRAASKKPAAKPKKR